MGAWIETSLTNGVVSRNLSHPIWVRGLKLFLPFKNRRIFMSHPIWVRGLKQDIRNKVQTGICRTLYGCVD